MTAKRWAVLIGFIVLSQLAGIIGSVFTVPAIDAWYAELVRPSLAPPNWLFGPVWTILYVLMGIAAFVVWRVGTDRALVRRALVVFGVQLILNTLWSIIFFGWQSPGWALVEIIFLWLAIVMSISLFARVSGRAAWLLAPYLAWVTFAGYLNYSIYVLN